MAFSDIDYNAIKDNLDELYPALDICFITAKKCKDTIAAYAGIDNYPFFVAERLNGNVELSINESADPIVFALDDFNRMAAHLVGVYLPSVGVFLDFSTFSSEIEEDRTSQHIKTEASKYGLDPITCNNMVVYLRDVYFTNLEAAASALRNQIVARINELENG